MYGHLRAAHRAASICTLVLFPSFFVFFFVQCHFCSSYGHCSQLLRFFLFYCFFVCSHFFSFFFCFTWCRFDDEYSISCCLPAERCSHGSRTSGALRGESAGLSALVSGARRLSVSGRSPHLRSRRSPPCRCTALLVVLVLFWVAAFESHSRCAPYPLFSSRVEAHAQCARSGRVWCVCVARSGHVWSVCVCVGSLYGVLLTILLLLLLLLAHASVFVVGFVE
jgi:hypothetical protein